MITSYLEMFEETFYPSAFEQMAGETIQNFIKNREAIVKQIEIQLNEYFDRIIKAQAMNLVSPIAEITFSFLYTSLDEQEAVLQLDCYGEAGRSYSDSQLSGRIPAGWLSYRLEQFTESLKQIAAQQGIANFVRPAGFEVFKLRAVRSLLAYFAGQFKYLIDDMLDRKKLAQIVKSETFVIEVGEYLDWQKVIFAILPEVDIFNHEANTGLCFRRFPAFYYQEKQFVNLTMNRAEFTDCTFKESEITGCTMNDCIFDQCVFERVHISRTKMMGCLFIGCTIKETTMTNVDFYISADIEPEEYYEPAEFYDCELTSNRFEHCNLLQCGVSDCEITDLIICDGITEDCGFCGIEQVRWEEAAGEEKADGVL